MQSLQQFLCFLEELNLYKPTEIRLGDFTERWVELSRVVGVVRLENRAEIKSS